MKTFVNKGLIALFTGLLLCCFFTFRINAEQGVMKINNITPNFGFPGSIVKIEGENFDPVPANNKIFFGGLPSQSDSIYTKKGKTYLCTHVPEGVQTCRIKVITGSSEEIYHEDFYKYDTELTTNGIVFMTLGFTFVSSLTAFSLFKVLRSKKEV